MKKIIKTSILFVFLASFTAGFGQDKQLIYTLETDVLKNRETNAISEESPVNEEDIANSLYGNIIAIPNIIIKENQTVVSGSVLHLCAEKKISLLSGFRVAPGSQFSASIAPATNYGSASNTESSLKKGLSKTATINGTKENSSYSIYPNPSSDNLNIKYELNSNSVVSISIVDFFGKTQRVVSNNLKQNAGSHEIQLNVEEMKPGVYFVFISINGMPAYQKVIIN